MRHNQPLGAMRAQAKRAKQHSHLVTDYGVWALKTAAATLQRGYGYHQAAADEAGLKRDRYRQRTRQYLTELYGAVASEVTTLVTLSLDGSRQPQRPTQTKGACVEAGIRYLADISALYQNKPKHTQGGAGWKRWFSPSK